MLERPLGRSFIQRINSPYIVHCGIPQVRNLANHSQSISGYDVLDKI